MIRVDIFATCRVTFRMWQGLPWWKTDDFQRRRGKNDRGTGRNPRSDQARVHSQEVYRIFSKSLRISGSSRSILWAMGSSHPSRGPLHQPFSDTLLEPGMVLCVEPYYMLVEQNMGFQIEDEIIVTEKGYELITNYKDSSELIQV